MGSTSKPSTIPAKAGGEMQIAYLFQMVGEVSRPVDFYANGFFRVMQDVNTRLNY